MPSADWKVVNKLHSLQQLCTSTEHIKHYLEQIMNMQDRDLERLTYFSWMP